MFPILSSFLMIENSSIEIGCIYFFQITINVFSSSSPLPIILEGLNKSTPTVMLVVYWSNFPSFRGLKRGAPGIREE